MGWISVKERLPDKTTMVFVCNERGGIGGMLAMYNVNRRLFTYYSPTYTAEFNLDVTHWYPLPERMEPGNTKVWD